MKNSLSGAEVLRAGVEVTAISARHGGGGGMRMVSFGVLGGVLGGFGVFGEECYLGFLFGSCS